MVGISFGWSFLQIQIFLQNRPNSAIHYFLQLWFSQSMILEPRFVIRMLRLLDSSKQGDTVCIVYG